MEDTNKAGQGIPEDKEVAERRRQSIAALDKAFDGAADESIKSSDSPVPDTDIDGMARGVDTGIPGADWTPPEATESDSNSLSTVNTGVDKDGEVGTSGADEISVPEPGAKPGADKIVFDSASAMLGAPAPSALLDINGDVSPDADPKEVDQGTPQEDLKKEDPTEDVEALNASTKFEDKEEAQPQDSTDGEPA